MFIMTPKWNKNREEDKARQWLNGKETQKGHRKTAVKIELQVYELSCSRSMLEDKVY